MTGSRGSLLINGATLIDGRGAEPVPGAAVLIDGERISYAGPSAGLGAVGDTQVIDASGKFVVPGLIDLHNHTTFDADMRTYVKNGITSIRFAGVNQDAVVAVRERVERGEVLGPRIFSCGPMLDKSPPAYPRWTSPVNTPEEATATARRLLQDDRVEALLVTQQITPDMLGAVAATAHEFGRPLVGQIWATDARQAAELGIDQIDNTSRIFASRDYPPQRLLAYRSVGERLGLFARGWVAVDWDLTQPIMEAMIEHGVYYCPTLVVAQAQARTITQELEADADYQTEFGVPEYQEWASFLAYAESSWTDTDREYMARSCDQRLEWMRHFRELGGQLVTGADMQFGGIMLHRELRNLAEVGLSANEVITAATGGAAKALGLADRLGTIQAGMLADLVVINADPLRDLGALRDIAYVIKGGAILRGVGSPATVGGPATVYTDHRA